MGRAGDTKVFELPDVARAGFSDAQLDDPTLTAALEAKLDRAFAAILCHEKKAVPQALALLSRHRFLLETPRHLSVETLLVALAESEVSDGAGSLLDQTVNRYLATTGAVSESSALLTYDSSTPTIGWHLRAEAASTSEFPQTICGLTIHNPPERPNQWTKFGPIDRWVDEETIPEQKRGSFNACKHCYGRTVVEPDLHPLFAGGKPNLATEEERWQVKAACLDRIAEAILVSPASKTPPSSILREPVSEAMTGQMASLAAAKLLALSPAERYRRLLGVSPSDPDAEQGQYPQGHDRLREIVESVDADAECAAWPSEEVLTRLSERWVTLQRYDSNTDRKHSENAFRMAVVAEIWPAAAEKMAEEILESSSAIRYPSAMAVLRSEYPEMVARAEATVTARLLGPATPAS